MKRKLTLSTLMAFFCLTTAFAQQDFKNGYNFGKISGAKVMFQKLDTATDKYKPVKKLDLALLKGIILKITEDGVKDTFDVKLWPVIKEVGDSSRQVKETKLSTIDNAKGDNRYRFMVDSWEEAKHRFDIPFTAWQLTPIEIPLRYNVKSKTMSDEFLNVNLSYSYIRGKTRFYESEFVKPRDRYWGVGGFAGLGMTKNSLDEDEVGLLYGANLVLSVFNVNFIFAGGWESSVSKNSRTSFYVGFGVGFDLFKLSGKKNSSE